MDRDSSNPKMAAVKYLFLMTGGICLYLLIRNTGWDLLTVELKRVGWGFAIYMGIHAADEALKTCAWQSSFPGERRFNWWTLYGISWIGSAVNHIYHSGILGSGATMVVMVRKEISTQLGVASVLITTLADALSLILFIFLGILFFVNMPDIPVSLKMALSAAFLVLAVGVIIFLMIQRKGRLDTIIRFIEKLPFPASVKSSMHQKSLSINAAVQAYHDTHQRKFWTAVAFYFFRRCFGVCQVVLVLYCLNVPDGIRLGVLISIFSELIDALFFFVPGRLGTHEGGRLLISKILGLTTAQGLTLGVVSRLNQIVWGLLGFGLLISWKKLPLQIINREKEAST